MITTLPQTNQWRVECATVFQSNTFPNVPLLIKYLCVCSFLHVAWFESFCILYVPTPLHCTDTLQCFLLILHSFTPSSYTWSHFKCYCHLVLTNPFLVYRYFVVLPSTFTFLYTILLEHMVPFQMYSCLVCTNPSPLYRFFGMLPSNFTFLYTILLTHGPISNVFTSCTYQPLSTVQILRNGPFYSYILLHHPLTHGPVSNVFAFCMYQPLFTVQVLCKAPFCSLIPLHHSLAHGPVSNLFAFCMYQPLSTVQILCNAPF